MEKWRAIRILYYCILCSAGAAVAFYFGPNWIMFRKLTWLAPGDFVPE